MTTPTPMRVVVEDGHLFTPLDGEVLALPIQFTLDGVTVVCTTVEEISACVRNRAIRHGSFTGTRDFEAYLKMLFGVKNTGPKVLGKWGERRTISFS